MEQRDLGMSQVRRADQPATQGIRLDGTSRPDRAPAALLSHAPGLTPGLTPGAIIWVAPAGLLLTPTRAALDCRRFPIGVFLFLLICLLFHEIKFLKSYGLKT